MYDLSQESDFTAANYLDFTHAHAELPSFERLTTGVPPAVRSPHGCKALTRRLAKLIGSDAAILGTSTLHIFWDLFVILAKHRTGIVIVGDVYPIARWGAERASAQGVPTYQVAGIDPEQIHKAAMKLAIRGVRPLLVSDGLLGSDFHPAPLGAMHSIAKRFNGRLVIDDTQALGVLGRNPNSAAPYYGHGGGGSLRWHGVSAPEIVVVASLAKGFGTPFAVLAASRPVVKTFRDHSETRIHASPPNAAALAAGKRALAINASRGDALRNRLLGNVRHFRRRVRELGLATDGGVFPVQTLRRRMPISHVALYRGLADQGIRTLLLEPQPGAAPRVAFVLTARHRQRDIDQAVAAIDRCLALGHPAGMARSNGRWG